MLVERLRLRHTESLRDRRKDELRFAHGGQRNEPHTAGKLADQLCLSLEREPGFAEAPRPRQGHEAMRSHQLDQLRQLALATDQGCRLDGEVRLVEALERRGVLLAAL